VWNHRNWKSAKKLIGRSESSGSLKLTGSRLYDESQYASGQYHSYGRIVAEGFCYALHLTFNLSAIGGRCTVNWNQIG
jgi:hypothetical protein